MSITFPEDTRDTLQIENERELLLQDTLETLIIQPAARRKLQTIIECAQKTHSPIGHILLTGGTFSECERLITALANTASVGVRTDSVRNNTPGDLVAHLTNTQYDEIVFFRDIEWLFSKKKYQSRIGEILVNGMQNFAIDITIGKGPSANSLHLELPHFNLIAAVKSYKALHSEPLSAFTYIIQLNDFDFTERLAYLRQKITDYNAKYKRDILIPANILESLAARYEDEFELKSGINLIIAQYETTGAVDLNAVTGTSGHVTLVPDEISDLFKYIINKLPE